MSLSRKLTQVVIIVMTTAILVFAMQYFLSASDGMPQNTIVTYDQYCFINQDGDYQTYETKKTVGIDDKGLLTSNSEVSLIGDGCDDDLPRLDARTNE